MDVLKGKKVAILVDNGFEQVELTEPKKALEEAGAEIQIVSPQERTVNGWDRKEWGDAFDVDLTLDQANPDDFHALVLPGGVINPDQLRINRKAVDFVKYFMTSGKPVAAICHGPWTLIETKTIEGRKMTSYESLKTDIMNAGANWTDQKVVVDQNLVTSRKPDDLPDFCSKMTEVFSKQPEPVHT